MKTVLEIMAELKADNRSHKLADMLTEMPASTYWRPILDEVSEILREHGNDEIHGRACFMMDKQRMDAGHYDNQGRLTEAGEKAQEKELLK